MDSRLFILGLLGAFGAFVGYFLSKCLVRALEMRDQDDYYRGYHEMYALCITHGSQSREVMQWLRHAYSENDGSPFDRGIVDAYEAYRRLNPSVLPK